MRPALKIILCVIGILAAIPANAQELGRLFFTPEQRARLDHNYSRATHPGNKDSGGVMLNGIVQRHGGKRTAWINGVPQTIEHSDEKAPESMFIPVPGLTKSVKLKVGQRVLLSPSANPDTTMPETSKQDASKQDTPKQDVPHQ